MSLIDEMCRRARPHFSDRLDGVPMPLGRRLVVAAHVNLCPMCRRTYKSLELTRAALRDLADFKEDGAP